jgi:hypothetical protein
MPTREGAPDATTKLRSAIEIGILALSALVAVGVAVLFLSLTGASRTSYTPRPQSPRYIRLSQYPARGHHQQPPSSKRAGPRSTPASVRTEFRRAVVSSKLESPNRQGPSASPAAAAAAAAAEQK